jgi:CubicO group peptidase (beta-lactamase class C family)
MCVGIAPMSHDVMWPTATPEEAGFRADLTDTLDIARDAGVLPNLHGVVAARGGRIFFERYFAGPDAARARPLGIVRFGPDTLHDPRSVTKSIVGLLYGIALSQGLVPPPETALVVPFPEYQDLATDPARLRLTISHALTMTLNLSWDELSIPYHDPRNSEIAMDAAPDRYRYILERPATGAPGERWTYCGGATALLARIIARGVGQPLEVFAREALFAPLGVTEFEWTRDASGEPLAASGLRMKPRDLARIGALVLAGGRWGDRRLLPAEWLAASLRPAATTPDGLRYGYHWYMGAAARDAGDGDVLWEETISAIGNGGQRLFLLPRLDLVVVVTAGNYSTSDQWQVPLAVLRDVLLPALPPG